ncbi:hypothetical protein TWF718_003388 [Orbilia javanica]|uniref:Glutathione S-transferase n=1 Tax=Orbilia javanica TaxID=47235 RepID=A0AAN8MGG6_9PEZI
MLPSKTISRLSISIRQQRLPNPRQVISNLHSRKITHFKYTTYNTPYKMTKYELLYWPGMPGRGEYVRLALEAAGVPYRDISNESKGGVSKLVEVISRGTVLAADESPALCPPILRVTGSPILLSQTPNILLYLGDHEGLAPTDDSKYLVHQYALTALDLCNEAHNVHHPVGVGLYYEDQKPEALRFAKEFRGTRISKFFGFFDKAIKYNKSNHSGSKFLVGDKLTYADTTVWQVVDGVSHAFPTKVKELRDGSGFEQLFAWYDALKEEEWLKKYLESERRLPYALGIFRHYPELDVEQ